MSLILGQAANGLVALRIPLALGIHEVTQNLDPGLLATFSIGMLGLSMIGNTAYDALTLEKKNYSNNYTSTLLQTATGKPYFSAISSGALHTVHGLITDPVLLVSGGFGALNGDPNLYLASMMASTVTGTAWSLATNGLIKHDKVHNAINWALPGINWVREKENGVRRLLHKEPLEPLSPFTLPALSEDRGDSFPPSI